ncbi:hypothetical protein TrVGV298_009841 [Trichoderma virens]|nr:hypothetical protein TrVGV298_009841 [Trichoderma virens]
MKWPLVQWCPTPRKPTAWEAITTFLLLLPFLASLLYRLYAKIRRRDGRSVGLQILSDVSDNDHFKYEIVAVHGLGANPEHTWTCKSNSKSKTGDTQPPVHLLKDLLIKDERFSDARILHFAYNSDWLVDACFESARDIGLRLIESLIEHRKHHARLPLIFVGHSFGGIVIKEALSSNQNDGERILEDTRGIIFLGTPHLGSPVAGFGATIAYLTGFLGSNTGLLLLLRSNGEMLVNLSKAFQNCVGKKHRDLDKETKIVSICEKKPTYLQNWFYAGKIVPWESATFGANFADVYEVDKDHSGLNKCLNSEDPLYRELAEQLHKMQPTTPPKINMIQQAVIDRLMNATAADAEFHPGFDEYGRGRLECLPQTREKLLKDIFDWFDSSASLQQHIYWLQGKAGTGKSTIARTVISRMVKKNRIVANFFFKRGESDRARLKRFFTTLTTQLVRKLPSLAKAVQDALESEPSLLEQDPRFQFKKLLQEPLQEQKLNNSKAIVVVIDALDECDSKEDLVTLIQQLSQSILLTDANKCSSGQMIVKYFLTSRLDNHIQSAFKNVPEKKCEKRELEKATSDTTRQDIERYLQFRMETIDGLLDTPPGKEPWSNPSDGGPRVLLRDILQFNIYGDLDGVYLPILNRRFCNLKDPYRSQAKVEFQRVIGSVISLADAVTVKCLARLVGQPELAVRNELRLFESVLVVPTEQDNQSHVRLFHESFRDFLAGPDANEEFKIDSRKAHALLASRCHQLLCGSLRQNICNLKTPGAHVSDVTDETIQSCLSPEVQYACKFWVYHLKMSKASISDGDHWYTFLVSHFLHWLEALSLLQRASESVPQVKELQAIPTNGAQARAFLEDAHRFILAFRQIIDTAPLQLYSSALTFAPTGSIVRQTFGNCRAKWITRTPNSEPQWSLCLQTLEGHSNRVACVAFSPQGILASGGHDGMVLVWDPSSGNCLQSFHIDKSQYCSVESIIFSKAGKIACRTAEWIVVWDPNQAVCLQEAHLRRRTTPLNFSQTKISISFADEQKLLFTDTMQGEILVWDLEQDSVERVKHSLKNPIVLASDGQQAAFANGVEVNMLDMNYEDNYMHSPKVLKEDDIYVAWAACFSRDNRYFASTLTNSRIKIWDAASTACLQLLHGREDQFYSLEFSPDNKLLATGDFGGNIFIWDWKEGVRLQTLTGHHRAVDSLAFSPDGAWLASASGDGTAKIWDATIDSVEGENTISFDNKAFAMAMDGRRLATISFTGSISQWWDDFGSKRIEQAFEVKCFKVAISSNGSILAIGLLETSGVQIWDVNTGNNLLTLDRPFLGYFSMALSADGERLITGFLDGGVEVWKCRTGQLLKEVQHRHLTPYEYHFDKSIMVAISSDGEHVAWEYGGIHSRIGDCIWTKNLGSDVSLKFLHHGAINLAFSQNGERLAAISPNWSGAIWDLASGACLWRFNYDPSHPDPVWQLNPTFINFDFTTIADLPEERPLVDCLTKYHISPDGVWIMRHAEKLLWLPPEYRLYDAAVSGSNIAIGRKAGRPFVIGLSDDGL